MRREEEEERRREGKTDVICGREMKVKERGEGAREIDSS